MVSVPGKLFVFGEYAVMHGGEAVLAALKPEFQCGWSKSTKVHPASPAGKFLSHNQTASFLKVENGLGAGFGSSTAELIAANEFLDQPWDEKKLWAWYREHFLPASGADLAVQNLSRETGAGLYLFQIHAADYRSNKVEVPHFFLANTYVFHCPPSQKIPTYSDLENKKDVQVDLQVSNTFIHRWLKTFDPKIMNEWADYLAKNGYESLFAHQVRKAFMGVDGVKGVKGCGAGLNDVFLVSIDSNFPQKTLQALNAVATQHRLTGLGSLESHV